MSINFDRSYRDAAHREAFAALRDLEDTGVLDYVPYGQRAQAARERAMAALRKLREIEAEDTAERR